MSLILHIDTAVTTASVCLAEDEEIIGFALNPNQKDHAAWLHVAIEQLMQEKQMALSSLSALAVSSGPGSYTGLRVGMAAVKGLAFTLSRPMITINTLQMMAAAADACNTSLLCPMIDARRMEVFTAMYTRDLELFQAPSNLIIDKNSFADLLDRHTISFFGNGSHKLQQVLTHPNAQFIEVEATAAHMVKLAGSCFRRGEFADLAYVEPYYGKDFYSTAHQQ